MWISTSPTLFTKPCLLDFIIIWEYDASTFLILTVLFIKGPFLHNTRKPLSFNDIISMIACCSPVFNNATPSSTLSTISSLFCYSPIKKQTTTLSSWHHLHKAKQFYFLSTLLILESSTSLDLIYPLALVYRDSFKLQH